jgi:hypothetical protein
MIYMNISKCFVYFRNRKNLLLKKIFKKLPAYAGGFAILKTLMLLRFVPFQYQWSYFR